MVSLCIDQLEYYIGSLVWESPHYEMETVLSLSLTALNFKKYNKFRDFLNDEKKPSTPRTPYRRILHFDNSIFLYC